MSKNTRTKKVQSYSFKGLLPWLLIVAGLLLLAAGVSCTSWKVNHQSPKLASREDVLKLKKVVTDIKTKLEDTAGPWQDTSSCTIIAPRLFGDETRYYCEVQYEYASTITGDSQVKSVIDHQVYLLQKGGYVVKNVRYPKFAVDKNDTFHVNQAGSAIVRTDRLDGLKQNCALGYTLESITSDSAKLVQQVRCYIDTDGTYLQKVDRV